MKKKLHFLFSMVALMLVATFAKAQVTINTDLTAQFPTDWGGWTGASGAVGWAAPKVTTNDGRVVAACEAYNEKTIAQTGVVFSRKLTGLANGTYMIELYGAAAFTPGRSCSSTLEEGDETAVYLYAETPAGTVKQFIPAHVAENFNSTGIATAILPNVEVTDGTITIGMYKEKGLTNWHVVQIKGVTATVDAVEVLSASVTAAEAIEESSVSANIYAAIQKALSDYNKEWSTADEYKAAIAAIDATVDAANAYIMAKDVMGAMKSLVDATNVYTADAYEEYYGQWAAKFEAGTLTKAEVQVLQNPSLVTDWHASINVDNFLLSAWDTNPDFQNAPYYINTWSVEGESDGTNFKVPFFEYFVGDDASLGAKTLTATMTGLEPGLYEATAWVRNQPKKDVAAADITGITLQVNDGTPVDVTEGEVKGGFNIGEFSARGVVGEDGKLLIKFIVADNNNSHWLSFKNVKFTNLGTPAGDEDLAPIVAEKAVAAALGVDVSAYENLVILPSEVEGIVNELKEAEYVQVHADYTQNAASLIPTFDKWEGNMVSNKGQHWDGTATSTYYEQTSAQWSQNNWTNNKKTTVNLPKGKYVLYAAGRASAGTACTAYIKVGEETRTYTSKGDVGFGVATDGTASFDPAATYANGNKGRGFEYRYVAFEVTADEGEDITLEIGGKATANHQWMSFTAPVLLTTADNAAIVKKVLAADVEIAQAVVEAKAGVGDDLFQKPTAAFNTFAEAVAAAKAVNEDAEATAEAIQNAVTDLAEATEAYNQAAVNTPDPEKLYTFQLKLDGETPLYMNLTDANDGKNGVKIEEKATPLAFVASDNAGQYYLDAEGELSVGRDGSDNWTMSTAADKRIAWSFTALGNGEYNINNLVSAGRFVGTNDADKAAGSTCYADKQTSKGNVVWIIAEYVDPNDYTNMIVNADLKGEGGFDATGTKGFDGSGIVKASTQAEFDFKQTIANLPAGQYKLTAQAAYRYGGDEAAEAAAIAGGTETKLVQLYATVGEKTVAAPVQNRYDGASETDYANGEGSVVVNEKYVPNSSSAVKAWFAAGQYVNEVIFNIAEAGDVTIGINRTGTPESDYTVIGPWTLTRLGDAEVEPEVPSFAGIVEQTLTHPQMGEIGTTTSDQTVKIAEAGEGLVDITFSGFSIEVPPTTLEQFTISNVAAETAADGSITYAAGNFQIATKMGQMDVYYNGTLEGVQASAEATPLFKLVLTNGVTDEVYFGADQDAIDAYKASLQPAVYAIAIADEIEGGEVEADVEEAAEGAKVTLTITPDQDYKLGTVTVSYVEGEGEGAETKYVEVAEDYTFTMPAAPVTVSATFTYVEPLDPNLIEIAQETDQEPVDDITIATKTEGEEYTQYTFAGGVSVAVKILDVDVKNCDYVIVKFAEPVPAGIKASFVNGIGFQDIPQGATEVKCVIADNTDVQNGVMPQISLLTIYDGNGKSIKVKGIYKHLDEEGQVQINDIDAAKAKRNGKFYKKGQFFILNGGRAFSLNGIETK